jgi:hypothetical protein
VTVEEYIRRAEDAERQARVATTDNERTALLRIAGVWRDLAQQVGARSSPEEP